MAIRVTQYAGGKNVVMFLNLYKDNQQVIVQVQSLRNYPVMIS